MSKFEPTTDILHQESGHVATEEHQNLSVSSLERRSGRWVGHKILRLCLLGIGGFAIVVVGTIVGLSSRIGSSQGKDNAPVKTVASAAALVSIRNLEFYPAAIEVRKGDVIEWKNDDLVPHTVTSASFDSGAILPGRSWRHTFTNVGKISYACTFHPSMKGAVIVK